MTLSTFGFIFTGIMPNALAQRPLEAGTNAFGAWYFLGESLSA